MDKVRLGILGAGGIAMGIHLPLLAELPQVELCAVCDCRRQRAETAAAKYGIPQVHLSYYEMLEKSVLDAVFVLTQPDQLFRAAFDCLAAGLPVFMEKPMGITLMQARALHAAALEADRLLHVGFNRRYIPLVVEIIGRLKQHTEITHVEGRFYKDSSPAFYDGCASAFECDVIHVTDLVRHLAGGNATSAVTMACGAPGAPAHAWYSTLRFDNGVSGLVRANYETGGRVHQFEAHGPSASAYIDLGFGGAGCKGTLLLSEGGTHSLSAGGEGERSQTELDGLAIAGSGRYEQYYGYADEDRLFIQAVLAGPQADRRRLDEDLASMELAQMMLDGRL